MAEYGIDEQIDFLCKKLQHDTRNYAKGMLKDETASLLKRELERHKIPGSGSAYADRYGYLGLGEPENLNVVELLDETYLYVDTTPPSPSVFANTSNNSSYQSAYRHDPYGADLSRWINEGLVPDIVIYRTTGGKVTQTYHKKGYIDSVQRYMDLFLKQKVENMLMLKGYDISKDIK